ncbi:hypothetical protein TNCV_4615681 [Trichonephila clavipes]|nr:hypothetical protein TNCV_4615681 [Trichonephila clavipes]
MHDDATADFPSVVCNHPCSSYAGMWIERGGHVSWPFYSEDLNPLDFFFWDHLKSCVYEMPLATVEDIPAGSLSFQLTSLAHRICLSTSDNPPSIGSAVL